MSSFADFNVGSIKLNHLGEVTKLTGNQVITPGLTVAWSELVGTIQDIADIADVVVTKEDDANKSLSITTDAASDEKYPSVKSVKTYVDGRITEQNQFINTTMTTLQTLQDALTVSNQVDATKEDKVNKSTNVETDATSDTKYPSVKAVKTYVDKVRSSLLIVEGESTLTGAIQWSCGGCAMEGLYGLLLPANGKIRRITGLAYGPLGNLNSIQVKLKTFTVNETSHTEPAVLRTVSFVSHPSLSMLYALDVTEHSMPSTDGTNMLLFEEALPKDVNSNPVSVPSYVRFRLTLEYETHI